MTAWLDAFVPVFGLLLLGALLRRGLLAEDATWVGVERLVFWVLLPCLLATSLGAVRIGELPVARMAATLLPALAAGTLAALALARALGLGHAGMTSALQGGIRWNTLMGLALAGGLWGPEALALAALAAGIIVPTVQVVVTLAFGLGAGRGVRVGRLARQVALNPLILGCLAGFALSAAGGLPAGLAPLLRALGQASVSLGLLTVGAALSLATLRQGGGAQAAVGLLKLAALPAATLLIGRALGLEALPAAVAALVMAQPTAPTGYVMARAMGGDAPLMAAIIGGQHLAAVVTLPAWAALLAGPLGG